MVRDTIILEAGTGDSPNPWSGDDDYGDDDDLKENFYIQHFLNYL
jgi:hypothetical protein